ncbi:hypothetical protein EB796_024403 [Bugula neritina]|uniref:Uncharacterized protein n=1 Tax=Bugula neritina TaxID=10212 RepID=A0A7J7IUT9_BUGNE|nr:hypothetical protein EB796_024403 [Bugula neritina]
MLGDFKSQHLIVYSLTMMKNYCEVAAHRQLDNLSSLLESANCDVESSKEIMDAVNLMRTTGNEDSLKVLTFLLPLMKKTRYFDTHHYLPHLMSAPTRIILRRCCTDSVVTVTDSAFSDMATSCCSDSLSSSTFRFVIPTHFSSRLLAMKTHYSVTLYLRSRALIG